MIDFKYGFEHKGFVFGWHQKQLYRLPSANGKCYPLKKLNEIKVGKQIGYRIRRDKFSLRQLQAKTILIYRNIFIAEKNNDLPF